MLVSARPEPLVTERVLQQRYVLLATVAVASAIVAGGRGDWEQFVDVGTRMLSTDGLHVYVRHPDTQTGPVSLLLARLFSLTPRHGFVLAVLTVAALGIAVVRWTERMAGNDRRARLLALFGGSVMLFSWANLGGYGHLDDALVLAAAVAATGLVRTSRHARAAAVLGLALTIKPWAVILLPILLFHVADGPPSAHGGPAHDLRSVARRWTPLAGALALSAVVWLPFFLAVPDTLEAIRPTVAVAPDSVLHLLGLTSSTQLDWLRPAQFVLALVVGLVCVHRRRVEHVLLGVIAARLATDPGTWSYYTPGLLAGALVWDVLTATASVPLLTLAAWLMLAPDWLVPEANLRAALRLAAAVGAVALSVSGPAPSAARWSPTSDRPAAG